MQTASPQQNISLLMVYHQGKSVTAPGLLSEVTACHLAKEDLNPSYPNGGPFGLFCLCGFVQQREMNE